MKENAWGLEESDCIYVRSRHFSRECYRRVSAMVEPSSILLTLCFTLGVDPPGAEQGLRDVPRPAHSFPVLSGVHPAGQHGGPPLCIMFLVWIWFVWFFRHTPKPLNSHPFTDDATDQLTDIPHWFNNNTSFIRPLVTDLWLVTAGLAVADALE